MSEAKHDKELLLQIRYSLRWIHFFTGLIAAMYVADLFIR